MNPLALERIALIIALGWSMVVRSEAQVPSASSTNSPPSAASPAANGQTVVLPAAVPDPLEPANRVVYAFNKGVMLGFIQPTAKVYRRIVAKPVRTAIGNFGRNFAYPGRLINNLLQGKWTGARDETYLFGFNTFVGVLGFIDMGPKLKVSKSDADFGQTFGQWGWKPHCYIMLPIFGPSNDRDTVGLAADDAANPLTYFAPYPFDPADPLTYFSPYTYYAGAVLYNNLSDSVDDYVRVARSEMDAYSELQYAWTFVRENKVADFQVKGQIDPASLETLESVFFTFKDREFPNRARTRSVLIPATGRRLNFTFWLQPHKAPVVYIIPGLGSHRLAEPVLALAELAYNNGFSAVCISSTFNFEFMENASTAELPAYMPVDVHDLHVALTEINRRLENLYPNRLGAKTVMGYSMGGFESLLLAAADSADSTNQPPLLKFDRYVAINSPVRLLYGISKLDEYFQAPLAWPAAERTEDIENTFLKVAALTKNSLTPSTSLPFSGIESKFLIGVEFRLILRDAVFSSQRRNNQGILTHQFTNLRRAPVYQEILQYSYQDYLQKFLIPYYWRRGIELSSPETLENASSLRSHAADLQANANVRVLLNRDDFLLPDEDLEWFKSTVATNHLTIFEHGGHLGNLSHPAVQKAIVAALEGLQPAHGTDQPARPGK